jgi:MFS family permease
MSPDPARPVPPEPSRRAGQRRSPIDLEPLRGSGQFRLLWSSRTVTLLGTQASQVALLVQARQLTGSALLVGLLGAAEVVPLIIFGLYGGVLADRLDRRLLAVWTEVGLGITAVLLTVNALSARPLLWPLYACAATGMALAALQRPSLDSAVPRLLPARQLTAGAALMSLAANASAIAGPAVGGLLAAGPGPAAAYELDAASFAVSVVLLIRLRPLPRPAVATGAAGEIAAAGEAGTALRDILAAAAYARGRPDLLGSYLADLAAMTLAYPNSLFPFLAVRLHAGWAVGLMFSAQAAGAVLASVTSRWTARVHRYGRAIALAAAVWGASTIGLGLAPGLGTALGFLALGGAADMLSGTFRDTLWNRTIPDAMRGRMAGVEVLSYGLGPSAGQIRAGAVADLAGTRFALWSGGLLCIVATGLTCLALPRFTACDVPPEPPGCG